MTWRRDEGLSIAAFVADLERERGTTLAVEEGNDPPDAICRDLTTNTLIAIEHTRVEPRDLASEHRWQEFYDALDHAKAARTLPGTFIFGPATLTQRFPTLKKIPLEPVADEIVDAVAAHPWPNTGATWEVSPTNSGVPPRFWAKVMLATSTGSEIIGVLPLSHCDRCNGVAAVAGLVRTECGVHPRGGRYRYEGVAPDLVHEAPQPGYLRDVRHGAENNGWRAGSFTTFRRSSRLGLHTIMSTEEKMPRPVALLASVIDVSVMVGIAPSAGAGTL